MLELRMVSCFCEKQKPACTKAKWTVVLRTIRKASYHMSSEARQARA